MTEGSSPSVFLHALFGSLLHVLFPHGDTISKTARNESSEEPKGRKQCLGRDHSLREGTCSSKIQTTSGNCAGHSCPPGCSTTLYKKVINLAERYLNAECSLTVMKHTATEYDRAREKCVNKLQDVEQKLAEIEHERGCIQKETNDKLNRLPLFCPLIADQIYCFTSNDNIEECITGLDTVGPKLSLQCSPLTHVLFRTDNITMLQSRTRELEKEGAECKEALKSLHSDRMRCRRECNDLKRVLDASKAECDELQMQKFGQIIDLELLDEVSRRRGSVCW